MKNTFVKTKNTKQFIALMEELQNLPANIPKMALVYGDFGLGKSQTIQWWAFRNNSIYVRATKGMTSKWLLAEIAEELDEDTYWNSQEIFANIERNLQSNPKTIIVDEVDYLIDKKIIETLRDIHDRTNCPMVLVGMKTLERKLSRYPHLMDRIYKKYKFEKYSADDIKLIISELSEIEITADGLEYLSKQANQFRQIVKLLNKVEKLADINGIKKLDEDTLRGILNERADIETLQASKQVLAS